MDYISFSTFSDNYVWDSPTGEYENINTVTVPAGKTLKVVLITQMNDTALIAKDEAYTNVDLRLVNVSDRTLEDSCSLYNNVEMVEYTAPPSKGQVVKIQYATVSMYKGRGVSQGTVAWYIE